MTTEIAEGIRNRVREALQRLPAQPGLVAAILTDAAETLRAEAFPRGLTGGRRGDTRGVVGRHWDAVKARNEARRAKR